MTYDPIKQEWVGGGADTIAKYEKRFEKKQKPKVQEVKENVDPLFEIAKKMTDYINGNHPEVNVKAVLTNRRQSCHSNKSKEIKFGRPSLKKAFERGFYEYNCVVSVWVAQGIDFFHNGWGYISNFADYKAVWALVLHEAAHSIQHSRGGRFYGSAHNEVFCEALEELIILFPYDEIMKAIA